MSKLKVLHLSSTTLSGSPIRIVDLINKHSLQVEARHIVWEPTTSYRTFKTDLVGSTMRRDELAHWLSWADVLHFHNRWRRQELFKVVPLPLKPALIQIHSPRRGKENFEDEARSGLPLAVLAQYHVREWPEASFLVPNVVDITDLAYQREKIPLRTMPVVSYAPSNWNMKGWDDKGYGAVAPVLKRLKFQNKLYFQLITQKTHEETMALKRGADIGVDEIVTGSYHLSSLEFLAMGIACFSGLDKITAAAVREVTGCTGKLPWVRSKPGAFERDLLKIIEDKTWQKLGGTSRRWMEKYWSPELLLGHYESMYRQVLEGTYEHHSAAKRLRDL